MHWYDRNSNPQHTIIGANGKKRSTTLRDARKLGYLPSVTGIIGQLDKPQLNNWKLDQLAETMTYYTVDDYLAGELLDEGDDCVKAYQSTCKQKAMESSLKARDEGERIHTAIEDVYKGEDCLEEYVPHVKEVQRVITELFGDRIWHAEETFASHLGYGGMCDLHSTLAGGWSNDVVLDFKTKDFTSSDKPPKGIQNRRCN